ncbi:MAG: hypothetical protein UT60_C0050G0002 [candidate division CPR2 bacterium GW2011_GWD2_39_7]|nr:MAG: hypothetical protein UT60_C0050G0002 [candidate division CPR2 bacterium GW2011_GWD2_39_7]
MFAGTLVAILMTFSPVWAATATNTDTGEDSNNRSVIEIINDIIQNNQNRVDIKDRESLNLNTGGSEANGNEGEGFVSSGDIRIDTQVTNEVGKACPPVCPSVTPTPIVSGVGGVPEASTVASTSGSQPTIGGVGGAVELAAGVGGAPEELPRVGGNNLELFASLLSLAFGSTYLVYWKRKVSSVS